MTTVFFTICSANYLPYARTLHKSMREKCPNERFICFLVDEIADRFSASLLGFECIEIKDIGCDHVFDMAARYTVLEMNTAIKPFCFRWLLSQSDSQSAIYLDPDIQVFSEFTELFQAMSAGADIVLTPHSLSPLTDRKTPDDLQLLRAGSYNLGFCALRQSSSASAFIDWWCDHLIESCIVDVPNGIFVDQKFCDLVPCYFENVFILRHAGYNVAYWNILHRIVNCDNGSRWMVNDVPLRFFHFSGVVPSDPLIFSKHQNRFTVHTIGQARLLLTAYLDDINGFKQLGGVDLSKLEYTYGRLTTGIRFTDEMRKVYRELFTPSRQSYSDAFSGDIGRYLTLSPHVKQDPDASITRLMHIIWHGREDLRGAFQLRNREGRLGLSAWFQSSARREHSLPEEILTATAALNQTEEPGVSRNRVPRTETASSSGLLEFSDWAAPKAIAPTTEIGVAMFGYFRAETGVGAAARANLRALRTCGVSVHPYNMPSAGSTNSMQLEFELAKGRPEQDVIVTHVNADCTATLESLIDPRIFRDKHRVGYWAWELADMPLAWVSSFERVDEVWCPSTFAANAFSRRTSKPVTVVPHPVAVPAEQPNVSVLRRKWSLPADRQIFLSGFDLNSFIARKNPEGVYKAFCKAFNGCASRPLLAFKVSGSLRRDVNYQAFLDTIRSDDRVIVFDQLMSNAEISELQWCCDAFVSLHRSEGFGLWIAECMARAKPCVVTNYSGNTDFCNRDNSLPIGFSMSGVQEEEYPFGDGQWWAEPDLDEAAEALRTLANNQAAARNIGLRAQEHVRKELSFEGIGRMMANRLFQARAEILDAAPLVLFTAENQQEAQTDVF